MCTICLWCQSILSSTNVYKVYLSHYYYYYYRDSLSTPYEALSGVPLGSVLRPILVSIFINDLCSAAKCSNGLLCTDDIKIYWKIKSHYDSRLLQSGINIIQVWCISNYMKPNINKTRVISLCKKTNWRGFYYRLCESSVTEWIASGIWECL